MNNDAPLQKSHEEAHSSGSTTWKTVWDWVKTILIALLIALPIRFFIAEPFIVSGASMDPTFASGQFLIVDRVTYDFSKPERGDVIIFKYPNDPSVYYIKRIIGLPGETLAIKDGQVTITSNDYPNGVLLKEPYVAAIHASHDNAVIHLEPDQYFVMGDNRAQSSDSRVWGPLDRHFIVGKPFIRLLPITMIGLLPGQYHAASAN